MLAEHAQFPSKKAPANFISHHHATFSHPEKVCLVRGNKNNRIYALSFPVGEAHAKFDYLLGWLNQLCCCVGVWLSNQKGPHASRPNICHSCRLFGFTMNHPPLIRPALPERERTPFPFYLFTRARQAH